MKVESLHRLMEDLREHEFFEGIGVGVAVMDMNFRLLYQNSTDKELTGDHVGGYCYRAYENREQVCDDCPLALAFRNGETHASERSSRSKRGAMTIEISASPIRDRDGNIIGGLEIVRDITDRRQAEEQLRESEERYRNVYDTAPLAFVLWDLEGRVTGWNDQAQRMFGWTREEITGKSIFETIVPESARARVREVVGHLLAGASPSRSTNENVTKSGQTIVCEWNNTVVKDSRGKVTGAISLALDITERVKLEKRLEAAALTDDLTGLLNRRGFYTLADQQCRMSDRSKRGLFLLFADLDNMKGINDLLGHETGDLALKDTAELLKKSFRESDIVARMGGDEFAVLILEPFHPDAEQAIVRHLTNNLAAHNERRHRRYTLSLSMGIARYDPDRPCSVSDLLTKADALMYENKKARVE